MNNRTKKWALVAGCLMLCAVLVGMIGQGFIKEPVMDGPLPQTDAGTGDVTVNPVSAEPPIITEPAVTTGPDTLADGGQADPGTELADDNPQTGSQPPIVIQPNPQPTTDTGSGGNGAVSTGTEQTIQQEPTKPEYDEDALTDPRWCK